MLRRTLLCAVLACPLAAVRLPLALALQAVWSLGSAWLHPKTAWYARTRNKGLMRRTAFSLCGAFACAGAAYSLCLTVLGPENAPIYQTLSFLSGLMAQASLLERAKKAGRRR